MTRLELVVMASRMLRDTDHSHYTTDLLEMSINRGIDRIKQEIPVLREMVYLTSDGDVPILLPDFMHELLSMFAQADALRMDERVYESRIANNDFELRLAGLLASIESGEIVIVDSEGEVVLYQHTLETVNDEQFQGQPYDTTTDGKFGPTSERAEYYIAEDGEIVPG